MRTVYNNQELAHKWMHKAQDSARNNNNSMFFNGSTIYSYGAHYPIATHVTKIKTLDNGAGIPQAAILFNCAGASPTTEGKHKNAVRAAIRGNGVKVFEVPYLYDEASDHAHNCDYFRAEIKALYDKAIKGNKGLRYERYQAIRSIQETANQYVEFFNLSATFDDPSPVPLDELLAQAWNDAVEHRSKVNARADAKALKQLGERQAREALRNEQLEVRLAAWKAGGPLVYVYGDSVPTMLRIKGNRVETSRGASVPIGDAVKVINLALKHKASETSATFINLSGNPIKVGDYRLETIYANGDVKIGCHLIPFSEIEELAANLKVSVS